MTFSVYALYDRNKIIAAILTIYLVAEFGVAMWIYLTPGGHRECISLVHNYTLNAEYYDSVRAPTRCPRTQRIPLYVPSRHVQVYILKPG